MVKADEILKLSKQMREQRKKRKASSPNIKKGNRFEVTRSRYLAMKGNKSEMAKKNMELARQRDMNKLSKEVNKITLPEARRILKRMIRKYKSSS